MTGQALTADLAGRLAKIALGHVAREYPNVLVQVLRGPDDVGTPRALHPIFFGSFDWHSCVHGHWLLARLMRRHPDLPQVAAIAAHFDDAFTPANAAAELAYFERPGAAGFERPYGWAWLLKLAGELEAHPAAHAVKWRAALAPLAAAIRERFAAFLAKSDYPVRAGVHSNSAFALALAHDHAIATDDAALSALIAGKALDWYGADAACQAWEPSGDDFLSPALMEAELMRRVTAPEAFQVWFARFLPRAADGEPATLFTPARVSDRSDGKIAHLDGVNLSRAWCLRGLAGALDGDDARRGLFARAAERHLAASLAHIAGDYAGEHWLASFALLALEA
jgi:hypothetical protein